MLNISYNTTRLNRIIEEFEERIEYRALRKKQNRGKAASEFEIKEAIERFLQGEAIATIASGMFRSPGFVKAIIERVGVPQKTEAKVDYLPDECCAEEFEEGELVWSACHHAPAVIEKEMSVNYQAERAGFIDVNYEKKYSSKCYAIYVYQEHDQDKEDAWMRVNQGGFFAYSLAYNLGKLKHLEKYGVNISRLKNIP